MRDKLLTDGRRSLCPINRFLCLCVLLALSSRSLLGLLLCALDLFSGPMHSAIDRVKRGSVHLIDGKAMIERSNG